MSIFQNRPVPSMKMRTHSVKIPTISTNQRLFKYQYSIYVGEKNNATKENLGKTHMGCIGCHS